MLISVNIPLSEYGRLLRRYLLPQRGWVALMAGLLLGSIGLQLIAPQAVRSFIDAVQAGAGEQALIASAVLFMGAALGQQALRVCAAYASETVAWTATNALRADLTAHVLRLDVGFHKTHPPGELIERVDGDVNALAGFFSDFAIQLMGSALLLLGVLVAVAFIHIGLALALAVFVLVTLMALGWVWQRGTSHWQSDRERSGTFYGFLGEALNATEDLRANGATPFVMQRFFAQLQGWLPVRLRASFWGQGVMVAAIFAVALSEAIAYGMGGRLFFEGRITLGEVYVLIAYAAMLGAPIETIRAQVQALQQASASIARVRGLLLTQSTVTDGMQALPRTALAVALQHVHFRYDDTNTNWTLQDVSFELAAGKVLGLLGHTGSGKTTLARLIFRQHDPQCGEVILGGVNLRTAALASMRASVGWVTQDVQLFAASLRDNITFFDGAVTDAKLVHVLHQLGLEAWLSRLPQGLDTVISAEALSAGEAQLIAFARVFIKDPGLVILDEASSRLDPATEALLDGAMGALLAGRTAIIIAHRLNTVERADDILILEGGMVVEHGAREVLAADASSRFARLRMVREQVT
jgi:ATP-binding cassette, subfamily B, bacterial